MFALIWPPRSFAFAPWPLGGDRALPDQWWGICSPINQVLPPQDPRSYTTTNWMTNEWMNVICNHISFSWPWLQRLLPMITLKTETIKANNNNAVAKWHNDCGVSKCIGVFCKWYFPGKSKASHVMLGQNNSGGKKWQSTQVKGRDLENCKTTKSSSKESVLKISSNGFFWNT